MKTYYSSQFKNMILLVIAELEHILVQRRQIIEQSLPLCFLFLCDINLPFSAMSRYSSPTAA